MTPFTTLTAKACPLQLSNVDTDQLIPARFMKRSRAEGYGPVLMYDLRFDENSALKQEFILNQPRWNECGILVAGRNFGGGSSREAAVYALVDYGIRCVIAPSFGDIFSSNAVNNGLLPARLNETACDEICSILQQSSTSLSIDLPNQLIQAGEKQFSFDIDPVWRTKLINGWDDISLTQSYADDIAAFADATHRQRPWNQPNQSLEQPG